MFRAAFRNARNAFLCFDEMGILKQIKKLCFFIEHDLYFSSIYSEVHQIFLASSLNYLLIMLHKQSDDMQTKSLPSFKLIGRIHNQVTDAPF